MNSDRPCTVLVAEDHPAYRERVRALLAGWGLIPITAADGRQALQRLRRHGRTDLLVTDLDMPHATGFDVIAEWLRLGGAPGAVIMVTGEADAADVRDRCAAGGICLIHKTALMTRFEPAVRAALPALPLRPGGASAALHPSNDATR